MCIFGYFERKGWRGIIDSFWKFIFIFWFFFLENTNNVNNILFFFFYNKYFMKK